MEKFLRKLNGWQLRFQAPCIYIETPPSRNQGGGGVLMGQEIFLSRFFRMLFQNKLMPVYDLVP